MAREKASRKYQLTINNPLEKGLPHEQIRQNLSDLKSIEYWCMCDEIGEQGTPHTHIYLVFKNSVMFSTLKHRFHDAHIELAKGTSQQNRDYICKEGKYLDSEKKETNLPDTFEEWGQMPIERAGKSKESDEIMQMVRDGASDAEILAKHPSAYTKLQHISKARETLLAEKYKNTWRDVEVTYIYGPSRTGKTRSVMEQYGYENVCRVTNYKNPFDHYNGQKVLLLEDYHSSLPIQEFLDITEGYPIQLRARYADKFAMFDKVYIISNLPLEKQYVQEQITDPATYEAFLKRIHFIEKFPRDTITDYEIFDSGWEKGELC